MPATRPPATVRLPLPTLWLAALLWLASGVGLEAWAASSQSVLVRIEPAAGTMEARARIAWPASQDAPDRFALSPSLAVRSIRADGREIGFSREGRWVVLAEPVAGRLLEVQYGGRYPGETPPRIAPEGSWLPGEADWIPRVAGDGKVVLDVVVPAGQRAVATGALTGETLGERESRAGFRAHAGHPLTLFVGPYRVQERLHRGLRLRTYFHSDAAPLAEAYLDDVARHLDRFAETIGPYPYEGFSVVAGPDPVGLGYPGLTYVSRRILHLPFMRGRSLAHEILHTWWGNAVQVAPGSGNWAEALTTFMADYRSASPAERDRMRREWLRDHAALPPAEDYPLARFTGKLHARDQVVGYGKGAFVFDMLEQWIGREAFDRGVALFYARHRGGEAGWAQVQSTFEAASGQDLAAFFRQWIHRTGAPRLAISDVSFDDGGVRFVLRQSPGDHVLRVPVVVQTDHGEERHMVESAGPETRVALATAARPQRVQVDPKQQVFRRLVAGELSPVLRDLMLAERVQAIPLDLDPEGLAAAETLLASLLPSARPVAAQDWDRRAPAVVLGMGEPAQLARRLGLPEPQLPATPATAWAWMSQGAGAPTLLIAARDAEALRALARPLPHYGRESWFVFSGGSVIQRGSWEPEGASELSFSR